MPLPILLMDGWGGDDDVGDDDVGDDVVGDVDDVGVVVGARSGLQFLNALADQLVVSFLKPPFLLW